LVFIGFLSSGARQVGALALVLACLGVAGPTCAERPSNIR
jgi:hypothetical protein